MFYRITTIFLKKQLICHKKKERFKKKILFILKIKGQTIELAFN